LRQTCGGLTPPTNLARPIAGRRGYDAQSAEARGMFRSRIDHAPSLIDAGEQFDVVDIDGSHRAYFKPK
jgi:hypothetical protein